MELLYFRGHLDLRVSAAASGGRAEASAAIQLRDGSDDSAGSTSLVAEHERVCGGEERLSDSLQVAGVHRKL